ncbi:MAG TPA: hypothetical protein VEU33_23550, partial [Archangium sp.]|nr:hypothetical protein [Archangium sp.]
AEAPESEGRVALAPWLVALAVAVLLAEVVVRRFLSGPRLRRAVAASTPATVAVPGLSASATASSAPVKSEPRAGPAPEAPAAALEETKPREEPGVNSALEAARERARRRFGR